MRSILIFFLSALALSSVGQQARDNRTMDDKQQIIALYHQMYKAMVEKDTATPDRIHAP